MRLPSLGAIVNGKKYDNHNDASKHGDDDNSMNVTSHDVGVIGTDSVDGNLGKSATIQETGRLPMLNYVLLRIIMTLLILTLLVGVLSLLSSSSSLSRLVGNPTNKQQRESQNRRQPSALMHECIFIKGMVSGFCLFWFATDIFATTGEYDDAHGTSIVACLTIWIGTLLACRFVSKYWYSTDDRQEAVITV